MSRPWDRNLGRIALTIAVALHLGVLVVHLPDMRRAPPQRGRRQAVIVRRYVPPPPPVERRSATAPKKLSHKLPVPDPTPEAPEPILEPEPEIETTATVALDDDVILGVAEPPPSTPGRRAGSGVDEPVLAGVGNTTNPVLIPESRVPPEYPEIARRGRVEADVILQAIVEPDGSVKDPRVLRCTTRGFGFEEAATNAIRQWRYEPALQDGQPVAVYFTIQVEFTLRLPEEMRVAAR
jgi:protein TonB